MTRPFRALPRDESSVTRREASDRTSEYHSTASSDAKATRPMNLIPTVQRKCTWLRAVHRICSCANTARSRSIFPHEPKRMHVHLRKTIHAVLCPFHPFLETWAGAHLGERLAVSQCRDARKITDRQISARIDLNIRGTHRKDHST